MSSGASARALSRHSSASGRALERIQRLAEIAPALRAPRIGFDRGAEQAMRFADLALLRLDRAEQIERVEMICGAALSTRA